MSLLFILHQYYFIFITSHFFFINQPRGNYERIGINNTNEISYIRRGSLVLSRYLRIHEQESWWCNTDVLLNVILVSWHARFGRVQTVHGVLSSDWQSSAENWSWRKSDVQHFSLDRRCSQARLLLLYCHKIALPAAVTRGQQTLK